jgi:hypothetical protein
MKKLKLDLENLDVVSFTAAGPRGAVHSAAATLAASCSCYPSQYCTGPGCVVTAYDGCMTGGGYAC